MATEWETMRYDTALAQSGAQWDSAYPACPLKGAAVDSYSKDEYQQVDEYQVSRPDVVTGYKVTYDDGKGDRFTTHQLYTPIDGINYKVVAVEPACFIPIPGFKIDDNNVETPKVRHVKTRDEWYLNEAVRDKLVIVTDKWEKPLPAQAQA